MTNYSSGISTNVFVNCTCICCWMRSEKQKLNDLRHNFYVVLVTQERNVSSSSTPGEAETRSDITKEQCLKESFDTYSHCQNPENNLKPLLVQHFHFLLTFVLFSSAWIPLSIIFIATCPSDISGRKNGGLTNTVCSPFGRPRYLVNSEKGFK